VEQPPGLNRPERVRTAPNCTAVTSAAGVRQARGAQRANRPDHARRARPAAQPQPHRRAAAGTVVESPLVDVTRRQARHQSDAPSVPMERGRRNRLETDAVRLRGPRQPGSGQRSHLIGSDRSRDSRSVAKKLVTTVADGRRQGVGKSSDASAASRKVRHATRRPSRPHAALPPSPSTPGTRTGRRLACERLDPPISAPTFLDAALVAASIPRSAYNELRERFPDTGFRRMLLRAFGRGLRADPLHPEPMIKF
jgi:hypothetical protein